MDYNIGLESAKETIRKIKQNRADGIEPERIHYSLAESLLLGLEKGSNRDFREEIGATKTLREWLSENIMFDVIKDTGDKGEIYFMDIGKVGFLGLTKLNLSSVIGNQPPRCPLALSGS